eukprot:scaffold236402_cov35-Attheya_sp.AAC.1
MPSGKCPKLTPSLKYDYRCEREISGCKMAAHPPPLAFPHAVSPLTALMQSWSCKCSLQWNLTI